MNSNGDLLEEYNYDPWGRRRNPADWSYSNVAVPTYTNRGFTGHEHLDMFNLIGMLSAAKSRQRSSSGNGRIYDSEIARFLSPDPIIQDPYNILSYNRYSYCMNNPLKYSDPSGYSYKTMLERDHSWSEPAAEFFNNYPGGWAQFVKESSFHPEQGNQNDDNKKNKNDGDKKEQSKTSKTLEIFALYLRSSFMLGPIINPFLGAEAIMVDCGLSMTGAEGDVGFVFILVGVDRGEVSPYSEIAGGLGSDAGVSGEITRIDYYGDIKNFSVSSLNGTRDKFYGGIEVTGELISTGGAISYGKDLKGGVVIGTTVQVSLGGSLIPFLYGGYNNGVVKINK